MQEPVLHVQRKHQPREFKRCEHPACAQTTKSTTESDRVHQL